MSPLAKDMLLDPRSLFRRHGILSELPSPRQLHVREVSQDSCTTSTDDVVVVEAWSQGIMIGSVIALILMTIASMRRKVLLHNLILAELLCASFHGTFIFVNGPAQGWYTSSTAALLYISYNLHNVINWIKTKPFLSKWASRAYIGSVIFVIPYWIAEIYLNFAYNNDLGSTYFRQTRPWEAFCREPWWLFTTGYLVYVIRRSYDCTIMGLIKVSSRFAILMLSMALSIAFIITDIVTVATGPANCAGNNAYWKLALIFKCTADVIFIDDFKSVLNKLTIRSQRNLGPEYGNAGLSDDDPALNFSSSRMATSVQSPHASVQHSRLGMHRMSEPTSAKDVEQDISIAPSTSYPSVSEHVEFAARQSSKPSKPPKHQPKEWFDCIESD